MYPVSLIYCDRFQANLIWRHSPFKMHFFSYPRVLPWWKVLLPKILTVSALWKGITEGGGLEGRPYVRLQLALPPPPTTVHWPTDQSGQALALGFPHPVIFMSSWKGLAEKREIAIRQREYCKYPAQQVPGTEAGPTATSYTVQRYSCCSKCAICTYQYYIGYFL